MKTFAHHDAEGRISSVVLVNAPRGGGAMLAPKPGTLVAEVEGLRIKDPGNVDAVREVVQRHRIPMSTLRCKVEKA